MSEETEDADTKTRLRCGEAANMIGVSVSQMRIMDKKGILVPEFTLLGSKQRIYSLQQVEDFITKMKAQKKTPTVSLVQTPKKQPSARITPPPTVKPPAPTPPAATAPAPVIKKNPLTGKSDNPLFHTYVIDFLPLHNLVGGIVERETWNNTKWPFRFSRRTIEMHGVTDFTDEQKLFIVIDRIHALVAKYEAEKGIIVGQEQPPPQKSQEEMDIEEFGEQ